MAPHEDKWEEALLELCLRTQLLAFPGGMSSPAGDASKVLDLRAWNETGLTGSTRDFYLAC